jgi:hypothetical protein
MSTSDMTHNCIGQGCTFVGCEHTTHSEPVYIATDSVKAAPDIDKLRQYFSKLTLSGAYGKFSKE